MVGWSSSYGRMELKPWQDGAQTRRDGACRYVQSDVNVACYTSAKMNFLIILAVGKADRF